MSKLSVVVFLILITLFKTSKGQKIEYGFGSGSDVIDSIRNGIHWYSKHYGQEDLNKLNLYIGLDFCNGNLGISISQYASGDKDMERLVQKSDRIVRINKQIILHVIFLGDVLADGIRQTRTDINMNGFYINAKKNGRGVWKVEKTQLTF